MIVNSIERGIVIDHITAGTGNRILDYLKIDTKKNTVAFIMNATSKKHGRKDLIKIENVTDVDLTVLGLLDPNCIFHKAAWRPSVPRALLRANSRRANAIASKCRARSCSPG